MRTRPSIAALAAASMASLMALSALVSADERREPTRARQPSYLRNLDPRTYREEGDALVVSIPGQGDAQLSLDPSLQHAMERIFQRYEVPYGGMVAMDPRDGRILSYVSHSSADPGAGDQARAADAPAASVFKVITASALLDSGVGPDVRACYHGGASRLRMSELVDDPRRDTACSSLSDALGQSINAVFAKLADKHLRHDVLARYASAFGFGEALPVDIGGEPSRIDIPRERLEFARTAAGFFHSNLSPLHGALIASTIANRGRMPFATVVDRVVDAAGRSVYERSPVIHREVIGRLTASAVNRMMQRTVSHGTSRRAFVDERGAPFLPGVRVAGKTGTLFLERPFRGYTWWIGFAPADAPRIAVAVMLVNRPEWRIKASFVAREALRHWLRRPTPSVVSSSAAPRPAPT